MAAGDSTAETIARSFAAGTDPGRRRPTNQDQARATVLPGGRILLIVADGVGGMGGGEVASAETVEAVEASFRSEIGTDPGAALRGAVVAANDRVRALQREREDIPSMATTVVVALVDGGEAWVLSVGDSRAYVVGQSGARQLTEDHSWVAEQVRAGLMDAEQAAASPHQNVITRAIGIDDTIADESPVHLQLNLGEALLLCSDGLHRVVTSDEMAAFVWQGSAKDAVDGLVAAANAAGGPDNIAVALHRQERGTGLDEPTVRTAS